MKRSIYFLLGILLLVAPSCDVLDQEPVDAIEASTAINDSLALDQAVVGIYSRIQSGNYWGFRYLIYQDTYTDNAYFNGTFGQDVETRARRMTPTNLQLLNTWGTIYAVISSANKAIEAAPNIPFLGVGTIGSTNRQRYIGEARALRGMAYFDLYRNWGGVPLVLTGVASADDPNLNVTSTLPRATEAEVLNQVLSDLRFGWLNMTNTAYGSSAQVRAPYRLTRRAARAYMARVFLQRSQTPAAVPGDLDSAIVCASDIIGSGAYALQSSYADVFLREGHTESIFELSFTSFDQNGISNGTFLPPGGQKFYVRDQTVVARGGGFGHSGLITIFSGRPGDLRRGVLIGGAVSNRVSINKYPRSGTGDDNVHIIRFAEMFLIRAEARARQGLPGDAVDSSLVLGDINVIRRRAYQNTLNDARPVAFPTNADALNLILLERRLEFAFEGHRLLDLNRFFPGATPWRSSLATVTNMENDLGDPPNKLWPIPFLERERNPNLTQNDGY